MLVTLAGDLVVMIGSLRVKEQRCERITPGVFSGPHRGTHCGGAIVKIRPFKSQARENARLLAINQRRALASASSPGNGQVVDPAMRPTSGSNRVTQRCANTVDSQPRSFGVSPTP